MNQGEVENITSPYYPGQYPLFQDCIWNVTASHRNSVIIILFHDLHVGKDYDRLFITQQNVTPQFDVGNPLITDDMLVYTGALHPRAIVVQQSALKISWDADHWGPAGSTGFWLEVSVASANCELTHGFCID